MAPAAVVTSAVPALARAVPPAAATIAGVPDAPARERDLAGDVEEVREQLRALGRQHALGVELHAEDGQLAVAQRP